VGFAYDDAGGGGGGGGGGGDSCGEGEDLDPAALDSGASDLSDLSESSTSEARCATALRHQPPPFDSCCSGSVWQSLIIYLTRPLSRRTSSGSDAELEAAGREFCIDRFSAAMRRARRERRAAEAAAANGMGMGMSMSAGGGPHKIKSSRRARAKEIRKLQSQGKFDPESFWAAERAKNKAVDAERGLSSAGAGRAPVPCYQRRSSPTYDAYRRRSPTPERRPRARPEAELPARRQYISTFDSAADAEADGDDARRGRAQDLRDRQSSPGASR
jgi:hypothetical protein